MRLRAIARSASVPPRPKVWWALLMCVILDARAVPAPPDLSPPGAAGRVLPDPDTRAAGTNAAGSVSGPGTVRATRPAASGYGAPGYGAPGYGPNIRGTPARGAPARGTTAGSASHGFKAPLGRRATEEAERLRSQLRAQARGHLARPAMDMRSTRALGAGVSGGGGFQAGAHGADVRSASIRRPATNLSPSAMHAPSAALAPPALAPPALAPRALGAGVSRPQGAAALGGPARGRATASAVIDGTRMHRKF